MRTVDQIDPERVASEIRRFFAIAFGATAVLHGSIVAFGLPFSLSLSSPVLLLYLLGIATPAAAAVGLQTSPTIGPFLRSALAPAPLALCGLASVAQAAVLASVTLIAYATGRSEVPQWSVASDFVLLAVGQIWVVIGEELGWRGYALPRLLKFHSPRVATLLLACGWGVWHAPMFFVVGSLQAREPIWLFAAAVFAWSSMHTALHLRTRPSIVPNLVFHAFANMTLNLMVVPPSAWSTLAMAYASVGVLVWLRLGKTSLATI